MPPDPDIDDLERRLVDEFLRDAGSDDEYEDVPEPWPVVGYRHGRAIPDLSAIPEEQWKDVLRECEPWIREVAVGAPRSHEEQVRARWAVIQLQGEDRLRREAALRESAPPPTPTLDARLNRRRDVRQVNFRLSGWEHSDLARVADAYGVSCPALARMLTMRGVKRALGDA